MKKKIAAKAAERAVVVTTAHRGVFFGYTTESSADIIKTESATLKRARLCVYWQDTKGFMGLASGGPTAKCKIGPGYWISAIPHIAATWSASQQERLAVAVEEGAIIAYWRSHADGRPSNGGQGPARKTGDVERIDGPLTLCGRGALHATLEPGKWKGSKVWVVALFGEVAYASDSHKVGSLHREILGVAWEEKQA